MYVLKIHSPGALGQRLSLPKFKLASGMEVRVYNPSDTAEAVGPFTNFGPNNIGSLIPPYIMSDTVVLELYVPPSIVNSGKTPLLNLEIDGTYHIYQNFLQNREARFCHRDPTCFQNVKDAQDATMMLMIGGSGGVGLCTGTLINNTGNRYFVLTAYHCYAPDIDTGAAFTQFVYDWETSQCEVPPITNIGFLPQTFSANVLARNEDEGGNDVVFMEAIGAPPAGTVRLGWSTSIPGEGTSVGGVHHPGGDYKAYWFGRTIAPTFETDDYFFTTNLWGVTEAWFIWLCNY